MEKTTRKSINDDLSNYCCMANESDYIEVTEWTNGEGYDITIKEKPVISLTHGELDAINYLVNSLMYSK